MRGSRIDAASGGAGAMRSSWLTKQSHDEWPGVVCIFGERRLIVAEGERGAYYRLQLATGAANRDRAWQAVPSSSRRTLAELVRDFADTPGLAEACHGLPDNPLEVVPEFWVNRRAEDDARLREWSALFGES